jgi:hypothetical protein
MRRPRAPQDASVNAWLLRAPRWQLALVMGALLVPFVVLLFRLAGDRSWTAALLMGIAVTIVCAPVLGALTASAMRGARAASASLPEEDRALVERASRRGPVPADDDLREAALSLAEDRLTVLRSTRTRGLTATGVLVLLSGSLAVAQSAWWWAAVAAGAALLVLVLVTPARLERRTRLLRGRGR